MATGDDEYNEEALALLSLAALRGIGQVTLSRLANSGRKLAHFFDEERGEVVLEALRSAGARLESEQLSAPWKETRKKLQHRAHALFEQLREQGVEIIFRSSHSYPVALLDLPDAPPWLFVQGNAQVLSEPSIAAVGTREPDEDGLWLARYVGLSTASWRCPTVSGLALGIDQQVHQGSVDQGQPTIAVLGTGILSDYPKNARELRERIIGGGGAIITEYLPNESYSAQNFVQRNRIQAALASALIPVQWKEKSGTAHTVRFAAALGRPIFSLRLPHWRTSVKLPPRAYGQTFTIPGDELALGEAISQTLAGVSVAPSPQRDLFGS